MALHVELRPDRSPPLVGGGAGRPAPPVRGGAGPDGGQVERDPGEASDVEESDMPLQADGVKTRELRERKALTLTELAQMIGYAMNSVHLIEVGKANGGPKFIRAAVRFRSSRTWRKRPDIKTPGLPHSRGVQAGVPSQPLRRSLPFRGHRERREAHSGWRRVPRRYRPAAGGPSNFPDEQQQYATLPLPARIAEFDQGRE
jgi:DNA-binding XRE family transcriptional regulator